MKTSFTPGPWYVDGFNTVAVLSKINDAGYQHVCSCDYGYALPDKALKLNQANACLISAAPSMFTALTELIEIRQQRMISGDTRELMEKEAEAYNKAYVAIEKAVPTVTYEIPAYPSDY